MGYRRFVDREGCGWDVKDRSDYEWVFEPEPGNAAGAVTVPAPGHQKDPFELSIEELQRMLDAAGPTDRPGGPGRTKKKSPFLDDRGM